MSRPVNLSARAMWLASEFVAQTDFTLPMRRGILGRLSPAQLEDGFARLRQLQRGEDGFRVRAADLQHAPPAGQAGYDLGALLGAVSRLERTLVRRANPPALAAADLQALRDGTLHGRSATRVHREALIEAFRLWSAPHERRFEEQVRAELGRVHGAPVANLVAKTQRPRLELAAEHARRGQAAEALLRLHARGRPTLAPGLLLDVVRQTGSFCGPEVNDVLTRLGASGSPELRAACARAQARIERAGRFTTAQVQLEAGPIAAGGIRSYVNALTRVMPALGHSQEVYLPLPGHLDVTREGLRPVAGSEGSIRDAAGREVCFRLYQLVDTMVGACQRSFYFIADDHYFTPRRGVYADASGRAFTDEAERLFAGAALVNAAMSKVAAIKKLGGGDHLTLERVAAAEQTLSPADVPDVIQFNDSHLAAAHALVQGNEAFRECAAFGVVHNGDPAYQAWAPRHFLADVLQRAGGRFAELLSYPGDVNLFELMLGTMPFYVVSDGYLQRQLREPSSQPRLQVRLQEAVAEGSATAIRFGIDLAQHDPSHITGTTQVAAYSSADLSGKARCKTALQAELGLALDATAPLLVYGGRLSTQKGIRDLLGDEARAADTPLDVVLRDNPRCQIVIGGPLDEPDLRPRLEALMARWPDNVRVQFGFVDNRKLMSAADVFLMPSVFEPCGLAQMEAQAMGCAVLHTNVDELPRTVGVWDDRTGSGEGFRAERLDLPSLVAALREAVSWASRSEADKGGLRRNAMARARTFDSVLAARNIEAFMRHAINLRDLESGGL